MIGTLIIQAEGVSQTRLALANHQHVAYGERTTLKNTVCENGQEKKRKTTYGNALGGSNDENADSMTHRVPDATKVHAADNIFGADLLRTKSRNKDKTNTYQPRDGTVTSGGDGENSRNVVIDPTGVQTAVGQVSSVIRPYEQAAMSINATQLLGYDDELDIEPAIADLYKCWTSKCWQYLLPQRASFLFFQVKKFTEMGLPALCKMQPRGLASVTLCSLHVGP